MQAASLKILHESDLKPYVVFLAPPSLQTYKQQKAKYGELYRVNMDILWWKSIDIYGKSFSVKAPLYIGAISRAILH